jgi:hypothetical protein
MKTYLKTVHAEEYSDGSKTLGILLNYDDDGFQESFPYIYNQKNTMYIFFNTIIDMMDYLLYGEMHGESKMKRAYMEEIEFDKLYDIDFLNGIFKENLSWVE